MTTSSMTLRHPERSSRRPNMFRTHYLESGGIVAICNAYTNRLGFLGCGDVWWSICHMPPIGNVLLVVHWNRTYISNRFF